MRIEFNKDVNHWHSKSRCTLYKKGTTHTVPHEFGAECVTDGSGIDVSDQPSPRAKKTKLIKDEIVADKKQDKPVEDPHDENKEDLASGDRS